jgi:hypothetical protein
MVSSLSALKLQAIYRIALSFETSEIPPPGLTRQSQSPPNFQTTNPKPWYTKFCNMSRTFKTTNQVYKLTWYLSVTSFYNFIASWYRKLDKVKKFWLNILTHKSRWIGNWLCNLFFVNERLLNVFSSSTDPNTWTIAIFVNLLYLLNFSIKNGSRIDLHPQFGNWIQVWTFNHYPLNIMGHCEPETWWFHIKHMWI